MPVATLTFCWLAVGWNDWALGRCGRRSLNRFELRMMELFSSEEHVSSWVMMMCGSLDVREGQEAYWLVNFDMPSFDLDRLLV